MQTASAPARSRRWRRTSCSRSARDWRSTAEPTLTPYPFNRFANGQRFLTVFADPRSDGLDSLATGLAPLADTEGLVTILFPQGRRPDLEVFEKLRALEWHVPFVWLHLAGPYTETLLREGSALPWVALQNREGRLLYEGAWTDGTLPAIRAALGG